MSTLVDTSDPHAPHSAVPADRLRTSMAAMRLSFTWFGVRKSLTPEQRAEAAEAFGAEGDVLSAGKRLINTKHPKYKAVTNVRCRAVGLWKSLSLPFPEPGIRLVKRDEIETIHVWMTTLKQELDESVTELDRHFAELKSAARERLGRLFNEADYPVSLHGLFDMSWDWPSVEPPNYLRQLSPELFEAESQRARARFNEAVELAENAFLEELGKLVSHLSERLSGTDDGRPKVFRDSAVENMASFFQRFRQLNIGSNDELEALVERAQQIVAFNRSSYGMTHHSDSMSPARWRPFRQTWTNCSSSVPAAISSAGLGRGWLCRSSYAVMAVPVASTASLSTYEPWASSRSPAVVMLNPHQTATGRPIWPP